MLKHSISISGFMALIDIATFDRRVETLGYETLAASAVRQTQQGRMFAWGCPEGSFRIRMVIAPPKTDFRPVESTAGEITTSGNLCISSYENLLYAAQFLQVPFPIIEGSIFDDVTLSIAPGHYAVDVHRMFKWEHGEQYPAELNEGDNFVLVLKPMAANAHKKPYEKVPWT